MSFSLSLSRLRFAAALAPVALLAGCAMTQTATTVTGNPNAVTLAGSLHGGNQPITGSAVTLYAVGTTGYGTGAVQYAATQSSADAYGSFSFSQVPNTGDPSGIINANQNVYSCPTSGDPQMYLVAKGGVTVPGGVNNFAVALITPVGKCSGAAAKFIDLNEVTTVATVAALQQYFNPTSEQLGYPNTTQAAVGFANGVATVSNLANIATGLAVTTFNPTSSVSGVTVVGTPEYQKVNTIANILASCVNTTGPNFLGNNDAKCTSLYNNAVPPTSAAATSQPSATYSAATDILSAAYYMLVNPTDSQDPTGKMANLYALAGGVGAPFQPALSAQPSDWTVGIGYTAPTNNTCATGPAFSYLSNIAIDATGGVWMNNSSNAGIASNLVGLSTTGGLNTCVGGDTITGNTYGVTIDTAGNVWMSSGATTKALQYKGGAPVYWTQSSAAAEQIVADGSGNLFYTDNTSKTVQEFVGAATASTPTASVQVGGATGSSPFYMAVDGLGNVFVAQSSTANTFYEYYPTTATGNTGGYLSQTILTGGTNIYNTYGVAVSASNKTAGTSSFVVLNGANAAPGQTVLPVSVTASTASPATAPTITPGSNSAACAGGIYKGRGLATDGAGNILVAAEGTANSVAMLTASLAPLSPAFNSPANCNNSTGGTGGFQKSLFSTVHGLAVDPTGNIWVTQSGTNVGVVEIVGQAVPVVTPISAGLANNTVGTKP